MPRCLASRIAPLALAAAAGGSLQAQATVAADSATARTCAVRVTGYDVSRWVEIDGDGMTLCVPPGGAQTGTVWRGGGMTVMWRRDVSTGYGAARRVVLPPRDMPTPLYGTDGPQYPAMDASTRTYREAIGGRPAVLSASYSGQTYWVEALWRQTPRPFVAAQIQGAVGSERLLAIARSVRFIER